MTSEDMAIKVTETDHRARSNTRRIEKLELQTEAIQSLATSVEILVKEQCHQTEATARIEANIEKLDKKLDSKVGELDTKVDSKVGELDTKVEALERKPAKRWESIVDKIILTVAAALVGFILAQIGIG